MPKMNQLDRLATVGKMMDQGMAPQGMPMTPAPQGMPMAPQGQGMKKGGTVRAKSKSSSASKRGDGIAKRGKTKGRMV